MLIDGLQCGFFDRGVFEDLKAGGFTCVTPTLGFWEGAIESLDSIGKWRDLVRANADLATIARSADDIIAADRDGKVALLFGYQNTNLLDGRIRYVELFAELGVRVLQLTYNNQNELGSSCYESVDPGLARFGREVVREMNHCGMLIDLSHVGDRTTLDTIEWSQKPVSITHANPSSVFPHKRNKSDAIIKALEFTGANLRRCFLEQSQIARHRRGQRLGAGGPVADRARRYIDQLRQIDLPQSQPFEGLLQHILPQYVWARSRSRRHNHIRFAAGAVILKLTGVASLSTVEGVQRPIRR